MTHIKYLSGIDTETTIHENQIGEVLFAADLQGAEDDDNAMLSYLVKTRNEIIRNPDAVKHTYKNPDDAVAMFDYAIQNWNNGKRQQALDNLAEKEDQLFQEGRMLLNGDMYELSGDGEPEFIGGFFKRVKSVVKNTGSKVKKFADEKGAKVLNIVNKLNPITLAARAGMLILFRMNMMGVSSILANGYLQESELAEKKISKADWEKTQELLEKVGKIFYGMGGNRGRMEDSIKKGSTRKPLLKKSFGAKQDDADPKDITEEEVSGLLGTLGVDPATTTAAITAASGIFVKILDWIKKAGLGKKEEDTTNTENNTETSTETTNNNESENKKIASNPFRKTLPDLSKQNFSNQSKEQNTSFTKPEDSTTKQTIVKTVGSWVAENPVKTVAIATVLVGGLALVFSKSARVALGLQKKEPALSGFKHKKRNKHHERSMVKGVEIQ